MRNSRPLAWPQRVDRLRQVRLPGGKRESAYSFACMRKGESCIGCGGGGGRGEGHQYPVSLEVNRRISYIPFIYFVQYL